MRLCLLLLSLISGPCAFFLNIVSCRHPSYILEICFILAFLAICDFDCENGGTCTAPNTCECVDGYSGEQCEIGMV